MAGERQTRSNEVQHPPQGGEVMTLLPGMTPTEDLFCEVLAGRFRVGEKMWTFSDRHTRTA